MHWFKLISGNIEKATKDSAAFDLFYNGTAPLVLSDHPTPIPTGVRTEFSPTLRAQIKEKSGLALSGIELHGGVIDADYRDEWMVIARCPPVLEYTGNEVTQDWFHKFRLSRIFPWYKSRVNRTHYMVSPGQKIAQFVLVELPDVTFTTGPEAKITIVDQERSGGLGSTGLKAA